MFGPQGLQVGEPLAVIGMAGAEHFERLLPSIHAGDFDLVLDGAGRPRFNLNFYAVNKQGEFGAASLFPSRFAVCDARGARFVDTASLYPRG